MDTDTMDMITKAMDMRMARRTGTRMLVDIHMAVIRMDP